MRGRLLRAAPGAFKRGVRSRPGALERGEGGDWRAGRKLQERVRSASRPIFVGSHTAGRRKVSSEGDLGSGLRCPVRPGDARVPRSARDLTRREKIHAGHRWFFGAKPHRALGGQTSRLREPGCGHDGCGKRDSPRVEGEPRGAAVSGRVKKSRRQTHAYDAKRHACQGRRFSHVLKP